jgi:hypothetical protein
MRRQLDSHIRQMGTTTRKYHDKENGQKSSLPSQASQLLSNAEIGKVRPSTQVAGFPTYQSLTAFQDLGTLARRKKLNETFSVVPRIRP